jgi:hypothetical protein
MLILLKCSVHHVQLHDGMGVTDPARHCAHMLAINQGPFKFRKGLAGLPPLTSGKPPDDAEVGASIQCAVQILNEDNP